MEEILLAVAVALAIFLAAVAIKVVGNFAVERTLVISEKQLYSSIICGNFGCKSFGGLSPPIEAMGLFIFTPKKIEFEPETGTMIKYG